MEQHVEVWGKGSALLKDPMCSLNIVYTEEAIKEIHDMFNNKAYYITPEGKLTYSVETEPLKLVLLHMTE